MVFKVEGEDRGDQRVLFLSSSQAKTITEDDSILETITEVFDLNEPQLVIQFLKSMGGIR